jgi:hypothetical protein
MDAATLLAYRLAHSSGRGLVAVFALLSLLALLVFVLGLVASPLWPADRAIVGPFRWYPIGPGLG